MSESIYFSHCPKCGQRIFAGAEHECWTGQPLAARPQEPTSSTRSASQPRSRYEGCDCLPDWIATGVHQHDCKLASQPPEAQDRLATDCIESCIGTLLPDAGKYIEALDMDEAEKRITPAIKLYVERAFQRGQQAMVEKAGQHEKKWREYEHEYITPCFQWAKEYGIDLEGLVRDNPGKNCVELLVRSLAGAATTTSTQGEPDEYPVCGKHRIYFTKRGDECWICNVPQHNHAVAPPRAATSVAEEEVRALDGEKLGRETMRLAAMDAATGAQTGNPRTVTLTQLEYNKVVCAIADEIEKFTEDDLKIYREMALEAALAATPTPRVQP